MRYTLGALCSQFPFVIYMSPLQYHSERCHPKANLECSYTDSPGQDASSQQLPSQQCWYSFAAECTDANSSKWNCLGFNSEPCSLWGSIPWPSDGPESNILTTRPRPLFMFQMLLRKIVLQRGEMKNWGSIIWRWYKCYKCSSMTRGQGSGNYICMYTNMNPVFHAAGHMAYACSTRRYAMCRLPDVMDHRQFQKLSTEGYFTF